MTKWHAFDTLPPLGKTILIADLNGAIYIGKRYIHEGLDFIDGELNEHSVRMFFQPYAQYQDCKWRLWAGDPREVSAHNAIIRDCIMGYEDEQVRQDVKTFETLD